MTPAVIGYTPNAKIPVYHLIDRRRKSEAACRHGIAATSSRPPAGFSPCSVCYGRKSLAASGSERRP